MTTSEVSQTPTTSYLTNDHLGSPRIITDQFGQVISRRDFMPFGEDIFVDVGARTSNLQYGSSEDEVRQKFTGYERDIESDLDFAQARYYNKNHGRFTSVDPLLGSAIADNPQSWNRYIYVGNNPLVITDPTGLSWYYSSADDRYKWFGDNDTVDDGYTRVVGTQGNDERGVGSFVYQTENGWVRLNPYTNSYSTFDTRDAATSDFSSVYQCNCQGLVNTIADESVRKGTTVALVAATGVAVGTGVGVAMAATGTAVGGGVTVLGLTEAGTATTAAATTTAATATATTAASQSSSVVGNAITGFTKHGINQAISREGFGVTTRAILNTLKNPTKIIQQADGTVKVIGKDAGVVLNQAGKVITTWARNSASRRIQ